MAVELAAPSAERDAGLKRLDECLKEARMQQVIPRVLSQEEQRKKREEVIWHARVGLYHAKRTLERADSNERREHALWVIKVYEKMLERYKEK